MKKIRILSDSFATNAGGIAERVLEAGSVHGADNPRAVHALNYGNGVEIDVPDEPGEAAAPADPVSAEPAPVRTRKPREPKAE